MIEFLTPVSKKVLADRELLPLGTLGKQIEVHAEVGDLPDLKNVTFAIFGVKEIVRMLITLVKNCVLMTIEKRFIRCIQEIGSTE